MNEQFPLILSNDVVVHQILYQHGISIFIGLCLSSKN